jgi:ArsR family transcriptional regulator
MPTAIARVALNARRTPARGKRKVVIGIFPDYNVLPDFYTFSAPHDDIRHIYFFEYVLQYIQIYEYMKKATIPELSEKLAAPLQVIASPQRVAILLAIGHGEACVCHLEAALGWRQAYISQHLMALRKADILQDRREGRYVYYRLKNASYLELIAASAALSGLSAETVSALINTREYPSCECPQCIPAVVHASSLTKR